MIKWMLVVLTTLFTAEVFAGDAYSQSRCDGIKKEREYIRSKMRQGYKAAEGERLKTRFTFLFKQLANHCDKPKKAATRQYVKPARAYSSNNSTLLNQKVATMSLYSDSYSNKAKLDAWSKFYKLPERCRKKGMNTSEFVWCSEYRGKQKALFEAQWKGKP